MIYNRLRVEGIKGVLVQILLGMLGATEHMEPQKLEDLR